MVDVIILVGGLGTRLRSVAPDVPKAMVNIVGRPFLEILLQNLAKQNIKRVILSVGYMSENIMNHFGDRFANMEIIYAIEKTPLGTGGAVYNSLPFCFSDHVLILNGDTFLDLNIDDLELYWQQMHVPTIVACMVADTSRYGRLSIDDNNRVIKFSEKGLSGSGIINAGACILPINIFNEYPIHSKSFSLETDFLSKIISSKRVDAFVVDGYFIDIGIPEDYERAKLELVNL